LVEKGVTILKSDENDFLKEQLSLNLQVIFVNNIDEAIKHISKYSSKHSD